MNRGGRERRGTEGKVTRLTGFRAHSLLVIQLSAMRLAASGSRMNTTEREASVSGRKWSGNPENSCLGMRGSRKSKERKAAVDSPKPSTPLISAAKMAVVVMCATKIKLSGARKL